LPVLLPEKGGIMGRILTTKEIGWNLRQMRQRAGHTQESLAEAMGITSQQIQKYESGANKLHTDRLQQLAEILKVPVQAFFSQTTTDLPLLVAEQHLLESYRAIESKDVQDSIATILANIRRG